MRHHPHRPDRIAAGIYRVPPHLHQPDDRSRSGRTHHNRDAHMTTTTPERWQRIAWAIGAHDLATDMDENDLEFTAWAEATHGDTARLALVIAQTISDTAPVHNHGPAEGRGLSCPESVVNGRLRGACMGRLT